MILAAYDLGPNPDSDTGISDTESPVSVGSITLPWVDDITVTQLDFTANQNIGAISRLRSISLAFRSLAIGDVIWTFGSGQRLANSIQLVGAKTVLSGVFNVLQPNPIRFSMQWNSKGAGVPGMNAVLTLNNFFSTENGYIGIG